MKVTIHLPSALRRFANNLDAVEVEADLAGAALEEMVKRFPDLRIRLFNDRGALHPYFALFLGEGLLPLDTWEQSPLAEGDTLRILPIVGGG
jgi:molybdopterin converting factor small subunit